MTNLAFNLDPGAFNVPIEIKEPDKSENEYGEQETGSYTTTISRLASIKGKGGREIKVGDQLKSVAMYQIIMRMETGETISTRAQVYLPTTDETMEIYYKDDVGRRGLYWEMWCHQVQ